MKALTICQPYAHLICLPETDPRHKRVENREWFTFHRGPLAIHAGKSRSWLSIEDGDDGKPWDANYEISQDAMTFGAVVAIAQLVECFWISRIKAGEYDKRYPWLRDHQHANGSVCWVLQDVKRLEKPVPWRGAQGLFEIPDEVLS